MSATIHDIISESAIEVKPKMNALMNDTSITLLPTSDVTLTEKVGELQVLLCTMYSVAGPAVKWLL